MLNDPSHLIHKKVCEKCKHSFLATNPTKYCVTCRTLACEQCSKTYIVKTYNVKYSRFCSTTCHDKYRMKRIWTENDIKYINNHFLRDMTITEIANHFSVSNKSVYNAIEKHNIQKRENLTKEDIIAEINDLHKKNVALTYTNMRKKKRLDLLSSSYRLFGSWKNAVESAGFNYSEINLYGNRYSWNTKLILETIKELYDSGESLQYSAIKENYNALYVATTADSKIGSWKNALEYLGIDYDEIKGTPWGTKYRSIDGYIYYSILEGKVADALYQFKKLKKIKNYSTQVPVSKDRLWTCDFLVELNDKKKLWIEVDGLQDKREQPYVIKYYNKDKNECSIYSEKIQYYIDNSYDFEIIYFPADAERLIGNIS